MVTIVKSKLRSWFVLAYATIGAKVILIQNRDLPSYKGWVKACMFYNKRTGVGLQETVRRMHKIRGY